EDSLRRHADHQAAMRLSAYVVVPYVPSEKTTKAILAQMRPNRGVKLATASLTRQVKAHRRAVREHLALADTMRTDLEALGMTARFINGQEVVRLLWERFNPSSADLGRRQPIRSTQIFGSLDDEIDTTEARRAAERLREAICQSYLDFKKNSHYAEIDRDLEQVIYASSTVEGTGMGWLYQAMMTRDPFTLSVFVHALDRRAERRGFKGRYRRLHATNRAAEAKGRVPDFERYQHEGEMQELLATMAGNHRANIYRVSIYQAIRARGPEPDVAGLAESVDWCTEAMTSQADCSVSKGTHQQELLWETTLPLGRDIAGRAHKYVTRNVGDSIPLVGSSCGSPTGVPFAFSDPDRTLELLNPYDRAHFNSMMLISGGSGSGKTQTANMIVGRCIPHGARAYALDRAGHYRTLVDLVDGARHMDIGADDSQWAINPWDLPEGQTVPSGEKVAYLLSLHAVMMGDEGLTLQERSYLGGAIRAAYAAAALAAEVPRESLLREELLARSDEEPLPEVSFVLRSLADRLGEFCGEGAYASIFDRETNVSADAPLVVFDTQRCQEIVLKPVMFSIVEYVIRQVEAHRDANAALAAQPNAPLFAGKSILLIDEGWHLVARKETGEYANDLARRARHFGLFLIVVSQQMTDFQTEYGVALLRNAAQMVLLAQDNGDELDAMRDMLRLTEEERAIVGNLKTVKGAYAQAFWKNGARGKGRVQIKIGPFEYWAYTSDPHRDVPKRKAAIAANDGDVWAAINQLVNEQDTKVLQAA
ncbi:MAG: VirB4 family type IV secretion system protein, partial [Vicinamibacterales bacterium]